MWVYVKYEGSYTTSSDKYLYAQAAVYNGAEWVAGEPFFIYKPTTTYYSVGLGRLSDNTAAVTYQFATSGYAAMWVLGADNSGNITVLGRKLSATEIGYAHYNPPRVVALSDTQYITFVARDSTSYSGMRAVACTFNPNETNVDRALTVGEPVQIFAGSTTENGIFYACKLNNNSVVVSCTAGGTNSYSSAAKHLFVVTADGTTVTYTNATLTGYAGPICYVENNKVIHCPMSRKQNYKYLTYDPVAGTFTAEDAVTMSGVSWYTYDAALMSDGRIFALAHTGTSANPALFTQIIADPATDTITTAESSVSGVGTTLAYSGQRLSSHAGWVGAMSGITSAQVASVEPISTAAPYVDRIDGVASSDGVTGGEMTIVVPY